MSTLREVSVYFDDRRLVRLRKESGVPKPLGIPKGLQSRSRLGTMNVKGVNSTCENYLLVAYILIIIFN
jgi:hypothetical protein